MKDINSNFDPQLANLDREEWYDAVEELAEEDGYFEPLGKNYSTIFHEAGPRLIVTFETFGEVFARGNREPRGFDMVRRNGWSHLCILSDGGRWYRDQRIYRYFDRLVDDGFFEDFDQVLFFGDGPGGYAAAAYSVVAPGANVLAIRPVATLDPAQAGWDRRFIKDRQLSFSDRYGYAPDMLEAAAKAFVVFDPRRRDACRAVPCPERAWLARFWAWRRHLAGTRWHWSARAPDRRCNGRKPRYPRFRAALSRASAPA